MKHNEQFNELIRIIKKLRSPDGCPWDREQTAESLKSALIEEVYETIAAIEAKDESNTQEELGDMLLLVAMISQIKHEEGHFNISDVLSELNDKLVRRHPHVFTDKKAANAEEALSNWEEVKEKIEGRQKKYFIDKAAKPLPPLTQSFKLQKRAAKVGFDWNNSNDIILKIEEELAEVKEALYSNNREHIHQEIGDLLFSTTNLARHLNMDPNEALYKTNKKFVKRFRYIEDALIKEGISLEDASLEKMDSLWEQAKKL